MTPWKIILVVLVLLVPGGSLVMLAVAAAKAIRAGRNRFGRRGGLGTQDVMAVSVVGVGSKV